MDGVGGLLFQQVESYGLHALAVVVLLPMFHLFGRPGHFIATGTMATLRSLAGLDRGIGGCAGTVAKYGKAGGKNDQ